MGPSGFLWGSYGFQWIPLDSYGVLWIPYGSRWNHMHSNVIWRMAMGSYRFLWRLVRFHGRPRCRGKNQCLCFFGGSKGEEAKQYEAMRLLTMRSSGRRAAAAVSSAALYAAATAVGDVGHRVSIKRGSTVTTKLGSHKNPSVSIGTHRDPSESIGTHRNP